MYRRCLRFELDAGLTVFFFGRAGIGANIALGLALNGAQGELNSGRVGIIRGSLLVCCFLVCRVYPTVTFLLRFVVLLHDLPITVIGNSPQSILIPLYLLIYSPGLRYTILTPCLPLSSTSQSTSSQQPPNTGKKPSNPSRPPSPPPQPAQPILMRTKARLSTISWTWGIWGLLRGLRRGLRRF